MAQYLPQLVLDSLDSLAQWRRDGAGQIPTAKIAQTMSRVDAGTDNVGFLSGREDLQLIWLNQDQVINNITFYSGATAAITPTNQWYTLRDANRKLIAVTTDGLTAAWAVNTAQTRSFATPITVKQSGFYYIGRVIVAATVPTLRGRVVEVNLNTIPPIGSGTTTDTGLTTPATAPATSSVITPTTLQHYATVG